MKSIVLFAAFMLLFFSVESDAQTGAIQTCGLDSADVANDSGRFKDHIRPLLQKYCIDCHSPGDWADLDFLGARTGKDVLGLRDVYGSVYENLEKRWMPPKNSEQPTEAERKLVTDWIKTKLNLETEYFERISRYVVEVFEDKKGNLWLGTMHEGAARYDGKSLTWFTQKDGLPSNAVPSFAEDGEGNLWAGTQKGVCKFDGSKFIKFGNNEGLPTEYGRVRSDNHGNLWAGMDSGVYRLRGNRFRKFEIPIEKKNASSYAIIPGKVSMMLHDSKGNLWFSADGFGAFRFDGTSFTHFTQDKGLCSNNVTSILEDQQGNIWFTCIQSFRPKMTGDGGVCRFDGKNFTKFPQVKGLHENDVYTIYEASNGDIWIGASGVGVYRYDGNQFALFDQTDRKVWTRNFGLQSMLEDRKGTLWFGFSGGLFRFNGKSFFNVNENGPWQPKSSTANGKTQTSLLQDLSANKVIFDEN